MKAPFFLYQYSIEEKNRFLEKAVSNLEDLIFVFESNSFKVIFHNNFYSPLSNWDVLLSSPNIYNGIRSKLNSKDIPAMVQLYEKIKRITPGDIFVQQLHILNKANVYGSYQIEVSLFDSIAEKPLQIMCKVHTIQENGKGNDVLNDSNKFTKIILVDDDKLTNILNKKILSTVLPQMQIEVFEEVDAALDWLKEFDKIGDYLIFLDINFPGRSGWDFMESYNEFMIQSKVIMLSSSIVHSDRSKALTYKSVLQYISKPLTFNFLETLFSSPQN